MIVEKNLILESKGQKPILLDVHFQKTNQPKPTVIFCHGFKGYKDWGAWHLVAEAFSKAGFFFVKFNFSHNGGTKEQPIDFPDLTAFSENNYSKELDDLDRVIDFMTTSNSFSEEINKETISLIGHSRGGGIVLIKSEENPIIKSVVTWAGVSDYKARFMEQSETFNEWKKSGVTYIVNGRTNQNMPLGFQFYQDFNENENRLTIRRAVKELQIPYLIIHGENDVTVTLKEAQLLKQWATKSSFKVIENGDHVFGAMHPWQQKELPKDLETATKDTIKFLKESYD
ncbi:MAG: alpha/beta hydrolase [Flavobacteriaceae bacterium]|nr:alpha/beta hydrolase [Flavobacteriaceae bacterium]